MSGSADRLARRLLKRALALDVPAMPGPDAPAVEAPDPLEFARRCGLEQLDAWQADVLASDARKRILCCSRQSGKSTITAVAATREALYVPGALVLLLSPSLRQSAELFRKCMGFYHALEAAARPAVVMESTLRLELDNGSRIIALPGSEATTRGYSAATLVCIDEASRVPDELIAAVRPALATTNGRLIVLSTPAGRRGWFYEQWTRGIGWERSTAVAADCQRISAEFLEDERRSLGEWTYAQEYECAFYDSESSVFQTALIERALSDDVQPLWSAV
jgi:phage FluMu gp28-like protein